MIIFRYLFKEVYSILFALTSILLLLVISNQFAFFLTQAVGGYLPTIVALKIIGLEIPILLSYLLPFTFSLAVLMTYSKLYADSEMTVLFACGVSRAKVALMTAGFSVPLVLVLACLTFFVSPWMFEKEKNLIAKSVASVSLDKVAPGRFQEFANEWTFYTEKISRDHSQIEHVFVAQRVAPSDASHSEKSRWRIFTAKSGSQKSNPEKGEELLLLNEGHQYYGVPGEKEFQILHYAKLALRIPDIASQKSNSELTRPIWALWQLRKTDLRAAGDLQLRISLPLSIFLFAQMSLFLSQVKPRQGKYARFLPAILIFIAYANFLYVAQNSVKKGLLSPAIGVWPVHLAFLLLLLFLVIKQVGMERTLTVLGLRRGHQ